MQPQRSDGILWRAVSINQPVTAGWGEDACIKQVQHILDMSRWYNDTVLVPLNLLQPSVRTILQYNWIMTANILPPGDAAFRSCGSAPITGDSHRVESTFERLCACAALGCSLVLTYLLVYCDKVVLSLRAEAAVSFTGD